MWCYRLVKISDLVALFELANITKTYAGEFVATPALQGISLTIAEGEFVSIMGASGSGKSTLMHIMGLLDKPTSGTYRLGGQDTAGFVDEELARIRNEHIGFVFQAFHLLARATVLENVMVPLQYSGVPKREWKQRAERALARVNMTYRLQHLPTQLSGGEKQRVAIARALIMNPKVIFADEPTGNLDSKTGEQMLAMIAQLHAEGRTVVLVTHELEAARAAKRMLTMRDGLVAADERTL